MKEDPGETTGETLKSISRKRLPLFHCRYILPFTVNQKFNFLCQNNDVLSKQIRRTSRYREFFKIKQKSIQRSATAKQTRKQLQIFEIETKDHCSSLWDEFLLLAIKEQKSDMTRFVLNAQIEGAANGAASEHFFEQGFVR